MIPLKLTRVRESTREIIEDPVTEESTLAILLNGKELAVLACSPQDPEELAAGFLYSAGLIRSAEELKHLTVDPARRTADLILQDPKTAIDLVLRRLIPAACGQRAFGVSEPLHPVPSGTTIPAPVLLDLMKELNLKSEEYIKTGGTHSAALADATGIRIFREDIGRHNAVDKVIGRILMDGSRPDGLVLLTSGRISADLVLKAARCGIPVVAARGAPTSTAVQSARESDVCLAGFVRGVRLNIYSMENRIT